VLHNELTAVTRILEEQVGAPDKLLTPGQVNGDHASGIAGGPPTRERSSGIRSPPDGSRCPPGGEASVRLLGDSRRRPLHVRSGLGAASSRDPRNVPGVSDVAPAVLPA
jgi:hypothetical protein